MNFMQENTLLGNVASIDRLLVGISQMNKSQLEKISKQLEEIQKKIDALEKK